jgi:hypothetical protein
MSCTGASPLVGDGLGRDSVPVSVLGAGSSSLAIHSAIFCSALLGRFLKQIPASFCVGPNHVTRPVVSIACSSPASESAGSTPFRDSVRPPLGGIVRLHRG